MFFLWFPYDNENKGYEKMNTDTIFGSEKQSEELEKVKWPEKEIKLIEKANNNSQLFLKLFIVLYLALLIIKIKYHV